MRVSVVTNPADHQTRECLHQPGRLHLQAENAHIFLQQLPHGAVFDVNISGSDGAIVNFWAVLSTRLTSDELSCITSRTSRTTLMVICRKKKLILCVAGRCISLSHSWIFC